MLGEKHPVTRIPFQRNAVRFAISRTGGQLLLGKPGRRGVCRLTFLRPCLSTSSDRHLASLVFLKATVPQFGRLQTERHCVETECAYQGASRQAFKPTTESQTVRLRGVEKGALGADLTNCSSLGQDPQGRTAFSFDRNHAGMPPEMSGLLCV